MKKLTHEDLYTLEKYARIRGEMRQQVMQHKQNRRLALGDWINLYFEDRLTMQYQIQEMLRIERIFEAQGIEDELAAYNPLIPDGSNWKATMMIEIPDVDQRRHVLQRLLGVEQRIYIMVEGHDRVYAIADEDLERSTAEKTSSVHFLRFDLDRDRVADLRAGAKLTAGCDHEHYRIEITGLPAGLHDSLLNDLD